MTEALTTQNRLIPIPKWNNYYDYPTAGAWRQLLFRNRDNIAEKVTKRLGGRILIDERAYFNFVQEINGAA